MQQALQKAIIGNRQLDFIYEFSVSYLEGNFPNIETLRYRDMNEKSIQAFLDKRSNLFQALQQNQHVGVCWTFPLSREKFVLKCELKILDDLSKVKEYWIKFLDDEERKSFASLRPDQPKVEKFELSDLDKFNAQEKIEISENFGVLVLVPISMVHTIFAMPQVVANSRTQFESLMKPYKTNKKYAYTLENGAWKIQALTIA